MIASVFPRSGCRPNEPDSELNVGAAMFERPTSSVRTFMIVPLPERRGPMSQSILCCDVSAARK